jgi:hypothetical protein
MSVGRSGVLGGPLNDQLKRSEDGSRLPCPLNDERRKEDVETQAVHSNEATSTLALMGAEAVQGISKVGNMETIPDQNLHSKR